MLFTGTYEHTIDSKQRLAIPSEIRDRIKPKVDGEAFYACIIEGVRKVPTLCLYTERGFELRAEQLDESELDVEEVLEYEQMVYSLSRRLELDKQGRVRLPEQLLRIVDPGKEIVLVGVKDHMEVHNRKQWKEKVAEMLANRPELLKNPRRVLRKSTQT